MKKCSECSGKMNQKNGETPEGVKYSYYKCDKCGEEILDMKQLHNVANTYRDMKRFNAKISKWGMSLGVRIPKELVLKYKLKSESEITIIPEKEGMKLIPL